MASIVYLNVKLNHFKVWGCDIYTNDKDNTGNVIAYFGKIGVPMQQLRKANTFLKAGEAISYALKKIREKQAKGYIAVENHKYFELVDRKANAREYFKLIEEAKKGR